MFDFATRYEGKDVDGTQHYFDLLKEKGAKELFFKATWWRDDFDKMAEHLDDHFESQQEVPDLRKDLDEYCDNITRETLPLDNIIYIMENTEHAKFIQDICKYLIIRLEDKCNAVLIHGAPNAGKTQFLLRYKEIFKVEYYQQTRGNFDCRYRGGR